MAYWVISDLRVQYNVTKNSIMDAFINLLANKNVSTLVTDNFAFKREFSNDVAFGVPVVSLSFGHIIALTGLIFHPCSVHFIKGMELGIFGAFCRHETDILLGLICISLFLLSRPI